MTGRGTGEGWGRVEERIELRGESGTLLGVLIVNTMRLQVKKGKRMFEVDLPGTVLGRTPVIFERVLHPEVGTQMDTETAD